MRHLKEYGTYLESLSDLPLDVDGDGFVDIVSSGWHSGKIWWSRNPGKAGGDLGRPHRSTRASR